MPDLPEAVVNEYERFKASEIEQFRVWLRRERAKQLRALLSRPDELTLETFNREVWRVNEDSSLRGQSFPTRDLFEKPLDLEQVADLRQALSDGELELHGNCLWGSGAHVFGAPLHLDDDEKLALIRRALAVLNGADSPMQKAEQVQAISGFGPNIATGLAMVFHPAEFQIYNEPSKQAVRDLGFADAPLAAFETSVAEIRTELGADDFIELDWFMYLRSKLNPPIVPDAQTTLWLVRGGERGQAEAINLGNGVVSIGWSDLPDLSSIASLEEMRQLYRERDPDATPANLSTQAGQVYRFVRELREGDLVLMPLKTRAGFVAIGRVTGGYEFRPDSPFDPDAKHTHPVEWLRDDVPVDSLPESVRAKLGLQQTVNRLDVANPAQLLADLLDPARNDIHLVVKWTPRFGATTDAEHIAIAEQHGAVWWGLLSKTGERSVSESREAQLREQLEAGHEMYAFIVGQAGNLQCWQTRITDFAFDRSGVDPELVPTYYSDDWKFHLWLKLTEFKGIDRDELYRLLDPDTKPGRPIALNNQTNPLFVRFRTTPRYWWVNQGSSFQRARAGRFLWAPLLDRVGRPKDHWQTMRYLRPGDVVFNYANGRIRATSVTLDDAKPASRPNPEADQAWNDDGLRVELNWRDLAEPVRLTDVPADWRRDERVFAGDGSVNQGYLFPLSDEFVSKLAARFPQLLDGDAPPPTTPPTTGWVEPPLNEIAGSVAAAGMTLDTTLLRRYHLSLKTRGFVVLSGVSGTGKTWLAEAYADAVNAKAIVVPVAPNWTTNEDLLGYLNPLTSSYHDTAFSLFLRDAASEFEQSSAGEGEPVPYHLILDEMNLARVEYYFAKFLSAMELRSRSSEATIELAPGDQVPLPPNLKFIGTVNVDETTHGFADKVYDRSQLIEMTIDREAVETHLASRPYAELIGNVWTAFAETAPFAFRVLDEIISYIDEAERLDVGWEEALDEQLLQKVLPKVKGTDLRLGRALRVFGDLTADRFPLSHEKASMMLAAFNEHGFTSYF